MAEAGVLPNPNAKKVIGITSIKEAAKNFKRKLEEMKESVVGSISEKIDNAKTKRAEKKYDKIRTELVMATTHYSEKQYKAYLEQLEKLNNMTPVERRTYLEAVMNGKNKEATKGFRKIILGLFSKSGDKLLSIGVGTLVGTTLGETAAAAGASLATSAGIAGVTAGTVTGVMTGVATGGVAGGISALATAVIANPIGLAILTGSLVAIGLGLGLKKAFKSKKFLDAEQALSNQDFLKAFEEMAKDVKLLLDKLDQTKEEWVQKAKTMKTKEYKAAYAKYVDDLVSELNLTNLDRKVLQKVFGGNEKALDVPVSEVEEKEEKEETEEQVENTDSTTSTTGELTEDQKKQQEEQRRLAEEQRVREEEARKKAEEENVVEEERE